MGLMDSSKRGQSESFVLERRFGEALSGFLGGGGGGGGEGWGGVRAGPCRALVAAPGAWDEAPPVVARDVHGIYAPWDSAPVSVDGVWWGGWYVACGGGGSKTPVMGPIPG
jgi:hypothetical protein